MRLRLAHKGFLLVAAILIAELVFLGSLFYLLVETEAAAVRANHAKQISQLTNHIWQSLSTGAGTVNYVFNHMDDKATMREFLDTVPGTFAEMEKLHVLMKNDKDASVGKVRAALATGKKGLKALSVIVRMLEQGNMVGARALDDEMTKRGMRLSQIHIRLTDQIHEARQQQLEIMKESPLIESRNQTLIPLIMIAGIAANIILAIVLLLVFVRGITGRLQRVLENTRALTGSQPLKPVLDDTDEIGDLDRVFHDMADTLAETSRKERAIIENATDVICSLDELNRFADLSPAAGKVWGYLPSELRGQQVFSLLPKEQHKDFLKALADATVSGAMTKESAVLRKDGTQVDMLWSMRWHAGERTYFCVAHDITERNQQEEQLRTSEARVRSMFDSVRVGLMTVTHAGGIESINSSARNMLHRNHTELAQLTLALIFKGARLAGRLVGATPVGHNPDDQQALARTDADDITFLSTLVEKSTSGVVEMEITTGTTGTTLPVEFSMKGFRSVEGERYLANLVDITEKYELDRSKQEFVAMISHDLRTPLNSVQGYLELLGEELYGVLSDTTRDDASKAERNVVALLRLVNDLLDIAKLDSGNLQLHLEMVRLADLLAKLQDELQTTAAERGVEVLLPTATQVVLHADKFRLERVLTSVITYAIKRSKTGGKVTVSATTTDSQDTIINVQDFGTPVARDQQDQIFERFRKSEGADRQNDFSLAVCKAIVVEHGGDMGITVDEHHTNNFWIRLGPQS